MITSHLKTNTSHHYTTTDYSRSILGFYLSKRDPGSYGVALAFRCALLVKPEEAWIMRGIIDNVYFDHGREYLSEHITGICLHLGTHIMTHEEYHPQAKGKLEQWFHTLEQDCLSGEDEYIGSDLKKRPRNPKVQYTINQLGGIIFSWIIDKYHERVHTGTGISPRKRWAASVQRRAIRLINDSNERDLDFLLRSRQRVISKLGIRHNNLHYLDNDYAIENHIGEQVTIYFDPWNPEEIFVYRVDNNTGKWVYLCTAHPRIKRVFDDEERQEVAAAARSRRNPKQEEVRASRRRAKQADKLLRAKIQPKSSTTEPPTPMLSPSNTVDPITEQPSASSARVTPSQSSSRVVRLSDLLKEYDDGQI